jgi:prephenate dehydrogenase
MKVAIFGIGLIGGSAAKDLRAANFCTEIIGVGRSQQNCDLALKLGLVDKIVSKDEAIAQADLIILTVPVNILIDELLYVLDKVQPHQIITDMGSTKGHIIDAIKNHPNRKQYVASHPMAGTENSGPAAAISDLFKGKVCIICDKENSHSEAVALIEKMYNVLGMRIEIYGCTSARYACCLYFAYFAHQFFCVGSHRSGKRKRRRSHSGNGWWWF